MSIKTWEQEYYPEEADAVEADEALNHSILKWTGLRAENLAEHDVESGGDSDLSDNEGGRFSVNSSTCALCHMYYNDSSWAGDHRCMDCPIYQSAGCSCRREYRIYSERQDPEPMIKLLRSIK